MFKHLRTSTKLLVLCGAFVLALGAPIYGLVREKQGAIEFARKELAGSRYLATLQRTYEAILAFQSGEESVERRGASAQATLGALAAAEAEAGAGFQTAALARAASAALDRLRSTGAGGAEAGQPLLDALAKAQALAWRIGDNSNLALDPDLDTYYVQNIVVRQLPTLLGQLAALQASFDERLTTSSSPNVHAARLPILAGLVRSTADEIKDNLQAAYRGNADGGLKRAVDAAFAAMTSSLNSYLGALDASALAVDARDSTAANRSQVTAVRDALQAWKIAKAELDRLLQRRIDGLIGKMRLDLALIGAFAALSLVIAALTHRHIVRPLERLEAVASKVRETKDYGLRVPYDGKDEIGRVTAAFNDMLAELAAARQRETAERAELARVTRLTTMGEMAASIAHEVNQPLAAIVSNANAGLRWLAHPTPDLDEGRRRPAAGREGRPPRQRGDRQRAGDVQARRPGEAPAWRQPVHRGGFGSAAGPARERAHLRASGARRRGTLRAGRQGAVAAGGPESACQRHRRDAWHRRSAALAAGRRRPW